MTPTSRSSLSLKRIGFDAGKSFDVAKLDTPVRKAIEDAPGPPRN